MHWSRYAVHVGSGGGCRCRTRHTGVGAVVLSRLMDLGNMQRRSFIPPAYLTRKSRVILVRPSKRIGGGGGGPFGRNNVQKHLDESGAFGNLDTPGAGVDQAQQYERRLSDGEVNFLQTQKHDLLKLATPYRLMLWQEQIIDTKQDENPSLTELLKMLHKSKDGTLVTASMETLLQSEGLFRSICLLLRTMVLEWARVANSTNDAFTINLLQYLFGEDPQRVAEELLLALVESRKDRAALVEAALLPSSQLTYEEPSVVKNLETWVGKILGMPVKESEDGSETRDETIELLAHSDPKYGVEQEHLTAVLQNIDAHHANALAHARHKTLLLKRCTTNNTLVPAAGNINRILEAWVQVGTLEAAQQAERIYCKHITNRQWNSSQLLVIKAYRNAALLESSDKARLTAVMRAKAFVTQDMFTPSGLLSRPPVSRLQTEVFISLLETYQNAGTQVIPDMGKQAQELMKLYMDEKSFNLLEGSDKALVLGGKRPQAISSIPDMHLLDALVITYAMMDEREFILKAVRLLNVILDASKKTELIRSVPTSKAVDGVVRALYNFKRVWRDSDDKQSATFSTQLIDILYRTDNQLPLPSTFQHVLLLLERSKSLDAPEKAEEILSRLEIRAALQSNRSGVIDRSIYHMVINCWREAARLRPGAAAKALRLLEKMEAQVSPYPTTSIFSPAVEDIASKMYNDDVKPNEDTYLLVLQTCFNSQLQSEKDIALNIALNVYSRMSERGIQPSESIVNTMLLGCKMLAPDDSEKRATLARTVYDIARDRGLGRKRQVLRSILSTASPGITSSNNNHY